MNKRNSQRATPSQRPHAVIYARVSSKEQEKEGYSIPAQLKLLRDHARVHGLQVEREFTDVETAKEAGRKAFGEMVTFLKQKSTCRVLLVEKTDRLYRNIKDWVRLDDLDLEIHLVKENSVLSNDSRSSEKFMHGIKVLMAKNFIDNLSEETRKGMLEKAEQGLWPSVAPIGYRNVVGANGKKTIAPDADTAHLVVRLFEWYATGNYSLKDLAKLARDAGLVQRRSGKTLGQATLHRVLRNRLYTGEFEWKGTRYQGAYSPLVSKDLWQRVQDALDEKSRTKHRRTKHDFPFSRLITCGHCGCSLVGELKKGKYVYYHCTGYKGKCPEPYVREEVLEEKFTEILKGLAFDEEVVQWVSTALRGSHRDTRRSHEEAIERLQSEYKRLENRVDQMYLDKLDGRVSQRSFDDKADQWRQRQSEILQAIEEHQDTKQNYLEEGIQLLELARSAHTLFEKQPPSEKRRLLNFVVSNSTWKNGELSVTYRQPFDLLAVTATTAAEEKAAGGSSGDFHQRWGG